MTDPVALGFAKNLARPGGNVTGFTHFGENTASTLDSRFCRREGRRGTPAVVADGGGSSLRPG